MAARTVCGSHPSPCPISATDAPSGRSSMPISTARFVLARGRSAFGTLAVAKSASLDIGLDCAARCSSDGVVFVDRSMLSEAPSAATAACPASNLVWIAADFDRACGVRRRGARWRLRAGLFASPGSTFAGLFACLRGCLLAIVFVLWIRIALRDAYTTTSPALGARRVATQKGPSTWTAMLAVPGKSSGKCGGTTILCYAASFLKHRSSLSASPLCQPSEKRGEWRRVVTGIGAPELRSGRRRSSHFVLSRFTQSSSAWCNRGRIAQVPEQLTLNQRVAGSGPAAPTIQIAQAAAAAEIGFALPGPACRACEPVPGDCELALYGAAARSGSCSAAVSGIFRATSTALSGFGWGLCSALIHSLQVPVPGFCRFGTLGQGNGSSAVEGRPAVLSRRRHCRV